MASFYDVGKENTNALLSAFKSYESLQDFLYESNSVERCFLNFAYDMDGFVTGLKELTCLFRSLHYLHLPEFHGNMIKNLIIMIKKRLSALKTACRQTSANIYSGYMLNVGTVSITHTQACMTLVVLTASANYMRTLHKNFISRCFDTMTQAAQWDTILYNLLKLVMLSTLDAPQHDNKSQTV